ncbi:MAG TPA: YitT family protein [Candidatus Limenecus avicola]|jgi:hypothetical protein|uniref:YitT family protein n=1 Tax=Candidatus Limenecus avicola TaxID=2840847 RepID=A0A9D1N171_9CLOT|nr:YitT family protein [Clostridium sp.]HIU92960.1 YitT family protein [Candidatus Limenecus avicola]
MKKNIMNIIVMTLGALIAAFSLEGFLIPNKIIDGGILGIAIMTNYKTQFPLGWCIFILNLPFIFLALKKMGKAFVAFTFYAVTVLSIGVSLMPVWLNHKHVSDPFLACIFGGLILGAGVGLVLRSNSSLDGTEILSISLSKKWGFSVGEIIMFFNLFIFTAAGFVYGNWQSSMYSMISYFIAYRVIDIVIEGLNESKSVRIITEKHTDIGNAIMEHFDISVTYLKAKGGYSGAEKKIIFCVINRLEIAKLKQVIKNIDESAFITIENVHEVDGGRVKKHHHHI